MTNESIKTKNRGTTVVGTSVLYFDLIDHLFFCFFQKSQSQ